MSRVWSAKRKEIEITYEFLDGTTTVLKVVSLSTNEKIKMGELAKKDGVVVYQFLKEKTATHLQKNDEGIVKKVILEQMVEGDLVAFSKAIVEVIGEETQGKQDG